MGFIKLTAVTFSDPQPISPKTLTINHKLTIGGSYGTPDTETLVVPKTGLFPQPFYILNLLDGVSYTVEIKSSCGTVYFEYAFITTCNCDTANGFNSNAESTRCEKIEYGFLTVTHSDYCLAISRHGFYASRFARIYNAGWSNSSIAMVSAPVAQVYAQMTLAPYWANPTLSQTLGVVNRNSVWIDSSNPCDGIKDPLQAGSHCTISFSYENTGAARTVYVMVAGDNQFQLVVNGILTATTTVPNTEMNFRIAHIFPVQLRVGTNDFNVVGTGDGSDTDAVAMVVYDNTAEQIRVATADNQLSILFKSADLVGQQIDVATCAAGFSLSTIGGKGNYTCRKVSYADCLPPLIN